MASAIESPSIGVWGGLIATWDSVESGEGGLRGMHEGQRGETSPGLGFQLSEAQLGVDWTWEGSLSGEK